ncbi:MAG: type I restriction enzyme HsdR N-terminal domain-containing protein [Paludibacteraceae bacterium]|nr:type I restriction enzyme HsdR N-terminal domain-containing protein [Paludibacteraceae bacterium]
MNYELLNMPNYSDRIRLRKQDEQVQIFDPIRGKWLVLTPEEWVRQNTIIYISDTLEAPMTRIANEVAINYNGLTKRCDSIIYDDYGKPLIIIEYKRTDVQITQHVFDQIATYNLQLRVPYLIVSNGLQHILCKVDFENRKYIFAEQWPKYNEL